MARFPINSGYFVLGDSTYFINRDDKMMFNHFCCAQSKTNKTKQTNKEKNESVEHVSLLHLEAHSLEHDLDILILLKYFDIS